MEALKREDFEKLKALPFFQGNIVSESMLPVLKIGDKITVEVGNEKLERFDIIVFWSQNKLVCHYVWAINRTVRPLLIQTRSTFYREKDYPIEFADYLGKVVSHRLSAWDKIRIFLSLKVKGTSI
ncbi:MAG: S26 family signal peptidase [Bdellovibrionota bacterium]